MNGILLVNKEKNMTSRDVVNIISKTFDTGRVGHTGTLDPIATGVMGIAINDGLKIVDLLINDTKEYIATVKMGLDTDTLDVTGNILSEQKDFSIEEKNLENVKKYLESKNIVFSVVEKGE